MDRERSPVARRLRLREPSQALMTTRTSPVTAAISVHGHLDGDTADDLRDEILQAVDEGVVALVIDLTDAPGLSFEGVKTLTLSAELMQNRGAALVVVARDAGGQSLVAAGVAGSARLAALLARRGSTAEADT